MSEKIDRRTRDFSKFDSMSTEQLQEILRLDAHQPEGYESDTEELFYIMEVLADRKRNDSTHSGKTVQQAYETFQKHYMPYDSEDNIEVQKTHTTRKEPIAWIRRIAAVAAVLAIFVLATVSVNAFGYDLWGRVARWSQEFFHFEDETQGPDPSEPDMLDEIEYASLQEALDEFNITQKLAPTWLPDGYLFTEIEVADSPRELSIYANYKHDGKNLRISIRRLIGSTPEQVEKSESLIEAYDSNGITYYIFNNYDELKAAWVVGEFECFISGKITIEQMKTVIDSI